MKITKSEFDGVYWVENGKKRPATLNLTPGYSVYGEKLVKYEGKEYRIWDSARSKISAALMKGMSLPIKEGSNVLYLGTSTGTTVSHVSDIVGEKGQIFGIEIAERVMRDMIFVAEKKKNIVPILADAVNPESYHLVVSKVDFIFEDVAMPNQAEILISNCEKFLKSDGYAMIAIKSRSVDVSADPKDIYERVEKQLSEHFKILDKKRLDPYEKDHMMFLLSRKT